MSPIRSVLLFSMFAAATSLAHAAEFPTAPPKLKDAEAQGLYRLGAAELKALLPGKVEAKGVKGQYKKTFKPDGSVDRTSLGSKDTTGTWRFDEKNNAYCNTFRGFQENCFAVFRAPGGTHYFDYEIGTGFYASAWRRPTEE